ncbi:MAG: pyridoxamine 5'-phosphate oxidase [Verrucomicrobia bacterium]|nr:pyridoxamine 5'-phosphate oxidase [Verrucomicrobiota bacterium]
MSIADLRREYDVGSLRRADLNPDPMAQFGKWFQQALETKSPAGILRRFGIATYKWFQAVRGETSVEANAMTLATASKDGRPAARMVLLKGVDARGFVFFSQYEGPKGRDLDENPQAALVFYWPDLERQVCVGGVVSKVSRAESEAYFKTRPIGSRLAAWVSRQSEIVSHRQLLEEKFQQLAAKYPNEDVPPPPYWGGYVLSPTRIEFWQGRPSRLHDRFLYTKQSDGRWLIERLAP